MNTLKSSEDDAFYKRAKKYVQQGDEHFVPVLEWFEAGKQRKRHPNRYQRKLSRLIKARYPNATVRFLSERLGAYPLFWHKLRNGEDVPASTCRCILEQVNQKQNVL